MSGYVFTDETTIGRNMILDKIGNLSFYSSLHPGIARAVEVLERPDHSNQMQGRYEIAGDSLFMMVQEYDGKSRSEGRWEAHRRYIDIQYVVRGVEVMGRADVASLSTYHPYDPERDVEFFDTDGDGDFFHVPHGHFVLFTPDDAHMPCLAPTDSQPIRKIVFKVLIGE